MSKCHLCGKQVSKHKPSNTCCGVLYCNKVCKNRDFENHSGVFHAQGSKPKKTETCTSILEFFDSGHNVATCVYKYGEWIHDNPGDQRAFMSVRSIGSGQWEGVVAALPDTVVGDWADIIRGRPRHDVLGFEVDCKGHIHRSIISIPQHIQEVIKNGLLDPTSTDERTAPAAEEPRVAEVC